MANYNTWLPGNKSFSFGSGTTDSLENVMHFNGSTMLASRFSVPNAQSGFGITADMVTPAFDMTVPPKVCYSSDVEWILGVKDVDGWMWEAECPEQGVLRERGWDWSQFTLAPEQDPSQAGIPNPELPAVGPVKAFQFRGAKDVHGKDNDKPAVINLSYVSGRSPSSAANGDIRTFKLENTNPKAHTWKVGTVKLIDGVRKEIKYYGALPFGFQSNGPRNRLAVLPYRGPLIAGYQSGTPWVDAGDNAKLGGVLDFCLDSQTQFRDRHPERLQGPFMHCYLIATWDCEQNGTIDTWVWDAPDGNPAWNGWQYRAFDSLAHTWYKSTRMAVISAANRNKAKLVSERFLNWIYGWMVANPEALYVPSEWGPPGWKQGVPLPPDSYLDPHGTAQDPHDLGLVLKGALFCAMSGSDPAVCRLVIRRCIAALKSTQVNSPTDPMRGAFTLKPAEYEVYGFHQGEIMDALGLALAHPELMK